MNHPCRDCEDQELDHLLEVLEPELEAIEHEVQRNSQNYIRWVQHGLNRIIGARLAVDGINGVKTRTAIRNFQRSRGLKVDGIVGNQTEQALIKAGAGPVPGGRIIKMPPVKIIGRNCTILDKFDFDKNTLKPHHKQGITQLARKIVQSYSTPHPIRTVYVEGHTDPVGTDAYNVNLSRRRALSVRTELQNALNRLRGGMSARVLILIKAHGESMPISKNNALNRRVAVCLSTKAVRPIQPPKPTPPQPTPIPPRPAPPSRPNIPKQQGCNRAEYSRRVDQCVADAKKCVTGASAALAAELLRCKGNPFCNAKATAKYYLKLRKCRDAIMPCDQAAKRATGC